MIGVAELSLDRNPRTDSIAAAPTMDSSGVATVTVGKADGAGDCVPRLRSQSRTRGWVAPFRSRRADLGRLNTAPGGHGVLIAVRRSKTNLRGRDPNVRYANGELAKVLLQLKQETGGEQDPDCLVFGGLSGANLSHRLRQAAEAAGFPKHITAHSGRVGLAVEC